ncbi:hypothetical protein NXW36_21970 [Bacteroides fragilis]|nr:hypothetical protein NXW36_21970 [Bacteroides fragilis]
MVFFILWLNMPGFGKAGISFLICIRLSFALIVQGLAKKYRSEARMIFSANRSKGPPCSIRGKKATFAGKKQKCGTLLDSKVENLCLAT